MKPSLVVVGSGFYGSTIARLFVEKFDGEVLIIEKRSHIGGNAWSSRDESTGIEIHHYGTHLFHTSNIKVLNFLRRFTDFNNYQHKVWTNHNNKIYSLPINLLTISQIYEKALSPTEARALLELESLSHRTDPNRSESLEKWAISKVGKKIYDSLIRDYTQKQWQVAPSNLPSEIISRLPIRFNFDNRYFNDDFEGLPIDGYGDLFKKILNHPRITVSLNTDYFETAYFNDESVKQIFSGPIDRYFNYRYGLLGWRTLDFLVERQPVGDFQGTSVMNFSDLSVPYTRIHEFKHLHPEREQALNETIIMREFSRFALSSDEPYYPISSKEDREKIFLYRKEVAKTPNVIFGGRLGTYKYLDMHAAIASAFVDFEQNF
jgi:UDP-galactopyranose mutase